MYAVTLDSQSITASELQSVYDEVAVLKDSVTGENVYSEEYLGELLNLAGKLYFAQVDIADNIATDFQEVSHIYEIDVIYAPKRCHKGFIIFHRELIAFSRCFC